MQVPYNSSASSVTTSIIFLVVFIVGLVMIIAQPSWGQGLKVQYSAFFIAVYFFATTVFLISRQSNTDNSHEQNLVEQQLLFSELYQNSPVPYIRTDRGGKVLHVNASAVRLLGKTEDELFDIDLFAQIKGTKETASHIARIQQLAASGTFVSGQEAILTRFDSAERWVMLAAFPYAGKSEILVTLVDITKQKNVETAKSEFVSLASHQLRTPIAAILWNIELLVSPNVGPLNEKQQKLVTKLERSAHRMSTLIKDFLDASQLEMGTFATSISEISLGAFITEQLDEFEPHIAKKALIIDQRLPETETFVQNDSHLLRMVVTNLISNAVKYTPAEGTIVVGYVSSAQAVAITVRDTGMGIPAAEQEKLFGKFYRASNVKASTIAGTGIGLYVVKQAVEMMGGTITFASTEGQGTEFVVTIPLRR